MTMNSYLLGQKFQVAARYGCHLDVARLDLRGALR